MSVWQTSNNPNPNVRPFVMDAINENIETVVGTE